jgi:hypothetical protein
LPLICTDVSELGSTLGRRELALVYRAGDADDLARKILEVASDPVRARSRARRAREFAVENWSIQETTMPVRRWIESEGRASDAGVENPLALASLADAARGQPKLEAENHQLRTVLGQIHDSKMWKVWMFYMRVTGVFRFPKNRISSSPHGDSRQ